MYKIDELARGLPENPMEAIEIIIRSFENNFGKIQGDSCNRQVLEEALDYVSLCDTVIEKNEIIASPVVEINLTDSFTVNFAKIRKFFAKLENFVIERVLQDRINDGKNRFQKIIGTPIRYKFSDGDMATMQNLINELRGLIKDSKYFEDKHKMRLLDRLERLQGQLHKEMSDLDHIWGLIGDAGVAVGKFGNDAKPFVDRIRELVSITWKTQAQTEEIPNSPSPLSLNAN